MGSTITLIASLFTFIVGKTFKNNAVRIILGGFFPVVLNALFLPLIWLVAYGAIEYVYYLQVVFLLVSQSVSIYAVGTPLYFAVKTRLIK